MAGGHGHQRDRQHNAAVPYPSLTIFDPPTQAEMQTLLAKLGEILAAANHA